MILNNNIVTIFTSTYNRVYILNNLYQSLQKQTCYDFEWIVVDDGSTDDTEKYMREIIKKENKFSIKYYKQENGGKHRAINKGTDLASGYLFGIVDSDDYLREDAIETIIKKEKEIANNTQCKYAGIAFCKGYSENNIIGKSFKGNYIDATSLERKKYNICGDKFEIFYTEILKKNKFPEFENEKFLTEAVVWNRIAYKGYKLRWYQNIIYICEYRNDGLTKAGDNLYKNSPKGLLLYINELKEYTNLNYIRKCLLYEKYSKIIYNNKNLKNVANDLNTNVFSIKIGIIARKFINLIRKKQCL